MPNIIRQYLDAALVVAAITGFLHAGVTDDRRTLVLAMAAAVFLATGALLFRVWPLASKVNQPTRGRDPMEAASWLTILAKCRG